MSQSDDSVLGGEGRLTEPPAVRLRVQIFLRWLAVVGQLTAVLVFRLWLHPTHHSGVWRDRPRHCAQSVAHSALSDIAFADPLGDRQLSGL